MKAEIICVGTELLLGDIVNTNARYLSRQLAKLGIDKSQLGHGGVAELDDKIWEHYGETAKKEQPKTRAKGLGALAQLTAQDKKPKRNMKKAVEKMAQELEIGVPTLTDIIEEVKKPGRDPREDAPAVIFRNDVRSFDDLKVDMELEGTVRNVVDFGAFVDIGVKNDGLVHISEMSSKYIKHPMDVVSVGDTVKVRIIKIDPEKQKIGEHGGKRGLYTVFIKYILVLELEIW